MTLSIEVDGERIGFRESAVVQANEPDADVRASRDSHGIQACGGELGDSHGTLSSAGASAECSQI